MTGDYGQVFSQWREGCPEIWSAYTRHAFVAGLGDGTLPRDAFLRYLRQDYVFLVHFSRAWALAIVKSDNLEEMKMASNLVHTLIHEEMKLHIGVCAAAGISAEELEQTTELPQNTAYTRYVLEAGFSGDFLDLMAALAPCVIGYGEIGARLQTENTSREYKDWIDTYAHPDYQQLCVDVGALIDNAVHSRLGAGYRQTGRWNSLTRHFETATALERDFWDMGLRG
jgi:thiaminase/transcriptional activator TenA